MKLAKALYANTADTEEELTFKVGDVLTVLEQDVEGLEGWWICSLGQRTGIAPGNRLKLLATNENHVHLQNNRSSKEVAGMSSSRHSANRQSNSSNAKSINEIPRKSGNVYIYDTPPSGTKTNRLQLDEAYLQQQQQQPDYDIPSRNSQQDYDIPAPLTDVQVMLSPDSTGGYMTSSNRSSMISVQSTGSQGSVTSSRLEHPDFRSARDSVLDDYDVPRSDVTEEESTSADSGVYCGTGVSGMKMKLHCDVTPAPDLTNQDYDVPEMYVTRVQNGRTDNLTSTPSTAKAVVNNNCQQVDVKLLEQYDVVIKNLARLRQYLNVINNCTAVEAVTVERQWSGQVKLAGLSVKTAMQELVDNYINRRQVQTLRSSLAELSHLLECFTASPSSRPSTATNRLPQHITMTSPVLLDETARTSLEAIKRLVELLPVQLEHFVLEVSDGSQTKSEIPTRAATNSTSSPSCNKRQTTMTSQQKSPASSSLSNSRKPPPPPTKPKPPKQQVSTLRRPNQPSATAQQEASCNKTKPASSETGNSWSAHDLDYADIAEQAEREMTKASPVANITSAALPPRPPSTSNKPPVAKKPDVLPRSSSLTASSKQQQLPLQLCDADQELIEFYALQVDAHNAVVQNAAQNFFQSMASDSMTSLPPEVLVRRSRLVVLAGHKLVYLGDALARHVTDIRVRDHVAFVANQLCDKLKSVVMATKQAALADISDIVSTRQMMLQSVDIAVRECLELATHIRSCNTAIITA